MNFLKINMDSTLEVIPAKAGDTLSVLQQAVGGYIEYISLMNYEGFSIDLVINEEGTINGMRPNFPATILLHRMHQGHHDQMTILFGDAVLVMSDLTTGETKGVGDDTIVKMFQDWRLQND